MIQTLEEAFQILDTQKYDIPFEAIEFVYNHTEDERIIEKIIYSLNGVLNEDLYYDKENDWFLPTPLWYAIIAENHLSEELFKPIIRIFTTEDVDWDFFLEQCDVLIGLLGKNYPDTFIPLVFDTIELMIIAGESPPYFYLFEAFRFCDMEKHKKKLLSFFKYSDFPYLDGFISQISVLPIPELIPILEKLQSEYQEKQGNDFRAQRILVEINEALKIQKGEIDIDLMRGVSKAFFDFRGHWKEHYEGFKTNFSKPEKVEEPKMKLPPLQKSKKIGRNAPCPCGSGKKYKKCCMQQ